MSTIGDFIKLKSGYANFVELKSAYEETQENADRMEMYRPTKSHRQAFERICRGIYQPNDKKFYLLSGSYGTGKSHLCLMTANFLSRSSGDPEMKGFYENYTQLDPEQGKLLKNIRKDGQYLVAICDYHSGRRFEDVVLKAVLEASNSRGLNTAINTEFDEAENLLKVWFEEGDKGNIRNFYEDFIKALAQVAPSLSIKQLRARLVDCDSNALSDFRAAFREMMGGLEFQPQSGNLIQILKSFLKSAEFKERFKGLAIFFDEFGFTLEKSAYSKDVLQGFMESICQNEPNVLFVGCIHQNFKAYADRFSTEDASVMNARITHVDLFNEGVEEIISAIVETDKQSSIWKNSIEPKTSIFDHLVPLCKSLNLFPWIDDVNRIRQRVLEDIYGMHPMALACLLRLSLEIGSNTRSTFTFFSGDVGGEKGSYADFIKTADITVDGGNLNLYTVDRLFDFFGKELSVKNSDLKIIQSQYVTGFYASMDALRKVTKDELFRLDNDERIRVLKTLLIYQLCQIPASLENIQFGLYCFNPSEKKLVEKYLKDLGKNGVIFYRQQSKTYELAASTGENPYDLINRYISNKDLHPEDVVSAFLEEAGVKQDLKFQKAKGYNLPFGEDKRFRMQFVRAKDIGMLLWDKLRKNQEESQGNDKESYEGSLVYALCEDQFEVEQAREASKLITDCNIALSVPHAPQPFLDTLLKVKACRHYLSTIKSKKISVQTESRIRDILENLEDGYLPDLKRKLDSIIEGDEFCWYWRDGKVLVDKPKQSHKPADMLCENLFKRRCRIKHSDLNYNHDDKWRRKHSSLKQAVDVLLKAEKVLIDNGNPDNHGEKRYLEKVLFKGAGALQKSGSEGSVTYFKCIDNPEKIDDDFPVLKALCERLAQLNPEETLAIGQFLNEVRQPPFGAGGTSLILSLAHVIRAYGERLVIYEDSTKTMKQTIESYDDIVSIVGNSMTKIVFKIREFTEPQKRLVELIAEVMKLPSLKHGETRSIGDTFDALTEWWMELPQVAKVIELYASENQQRLSALKGIFDGQLSNANSFEVLLEYIPAIYIDNVVGNNLTESAVESVAKLFEEDVNQLNGGEHEINRRVADAICKVFGGSGDMVECENLVTNWYESLNANQRDPRRVDNEDAKHFLESLATHSNQFDTKIVKLLPKKYGFGTVADWTSLHIEDYAVKIKQSKAEIDKAKPSVPAPPIDGRIFVIRKTDKKTVNIPEGTVSLIFTVDGTDPRLSKTSETASKDLDLLDLLNSKSNVNIKMRAVDSEGNMSDIVAFEVVSHERKYDVQIEGDLVDEHKAKFIWPSDIDGLMAVLKSLVSIGVSKNLLSEEQAELVLSNICKILKSD